MAPRAIKELFARLPLKTYPNDGAGDYPRRPKDGHSDRPDESLQSSNSNAATGSNAMIGSAAATKAMLYVIDEVDYDGDCTDPDGLYLQLLLRLSGQQFAVQRTSRHASPLLQLPFIVIDGKAIASSEAIARWTASKCPILSKQRPHARAINVMIRRSLGPLYIYERFFKRNNASRVDRSSAIAMLLNRYEDRSFAFETIAELESDKALANGAPASAIDEEDILFRAARTLDALESILPSESGIISGGQPSETDIIAYAHLHALKLNLAPNRAGALFTDRPQVDDFYEKALNYFKRSK